MLLAVKRALNLNRCNRSCDDLFVCSRQEFKEIDGIRLGCIKLEKG
jgi:hypothetical protein